MFDVAGLRYLDSYPGLNYVTMFFWFREIKQLREVRETGEVKDIIKVRKVREITWARGIRWVK